MSGTWILDLGSFISVEANKPIRSRHQIIHDRESGKRGVFCQREMALMRAVGTRIQIQSSSFEFLQVCLRNSFHGFIDAIEIHIYTAFHGRLGYVQSVTKAWLIRGTGDEHAKFFSTQFHGRTVNARALKCQRVARRQNEWNGEIQKDLEPSDRREK